MLYCTPETIKTLREALAKRKRTGEPSPEMFLPDEIIAIFKAFDLAGMAHYNYIHDATDQLEYSKEEYNQEDIDKARQNVYLMVGVIESLLDENAELRSQIETKPSGN